MLTRSEIREQVTAKLLNQTTAGAQVHNARVLSLDSDILPALVVHTPSEIAQDDVLLISMEIEAFTSADITQSLGTLIDTLCQQTQDALHRFWEDSGDYTATYSGTDISYEVEGRQPVAAARITYQIEVLNE
jgi:hypothetical protein